ncbi:hypothetical protein [Clostridium sp. KNHs205]|nr:hypothetical protein [Clostridium sp. KNHs205]
MDLCQYFHAGGFTTGDKSDDESILPGYAVRVTLRPESIIR